MKDADDCARTKAGAIAIDEVLSANSVEHKPVFAERESFFDCADKRRQFDLTIHEIPGVGYTGRAYEVTSNVHGGYVFTSVARASLPLTLARLRGKIRAGLAQRFLISDGDHLDMPLERLCGRIDREGVVVDGRLLDWEALRSLLEPYEGWDFELHIPFEQS